ncbi:hypothetical protein D3C74_430030 [compost metagenome]
MTLLPMVTSTLAAIPTPALIMTSSPIVNRAPLTTVSWVPQGLPMMLSRFPTCKSPCLLRYTFPLIRGSRPIEG